MQQCTLCADITSDFYGSDALMANSNLRSSFITSLYELNEIQFDLAPTGYDLDVGWPTFARYVSIPDDRSRRVAKETQSLSCSRVSRVYKQ